MDHCGIRSDISSGFCHMSGVVRFECGRTTTHIRVDAAVNHYLLEAPLFISIASGAWSEAGKLSLSLIAALVSTLRPVCPPAESNPPGSGRLDPDGFLEAHTHTCLLVVCACVPAEPASQGALPEGAGRDGRVAGRGDRQLGARWGHTTAPHDSTGAPRQCLAEVSRKYTIP